MNWIKRNIIFVASLAVALILMLLGGFLLFTSIQESSTLEEEYNTALASLQGIHSSPAHPGEGKINNLNIARTNLAALQGVLEEAKTIFGTVTIQTNVSDVEFKARLENTIHELQQIANEKAIGLPPDFSFTFASQRGKLSFSPGSVPGWLLQLSDVRAITDVLYAANVNAIDNIRRAAISTDEKGGTSEILPITITTNEGALSLPYEVTFRCFSEELAAAMQGFVTSSNFLIVKTFSIEPAKLDSLGGTGTQTGNAQTPQLLNRGQVLPTGGRVPPGGVAARPPSGLQPFLSEKQLSVTLAIDSVRLMAPEADAGGKNNAPAQ